jgi:hypothetical protein
MIMHILDFALGIKIRKQMLDDGLCEALPKRSGGS